MKKVLLPWDQVFLGLPFPLALGIVILVMKFVHDEAHVRCPNHLRRLVRRSVVPSCMPNKAHIVSAVTLSLSPDPIQNPNNNESITTDSQP